MKIGIAVAAASLLLALVPRTSRDVTLRTVRRIPGVARVANTVRNRVSAEPEQSGPPRPMAPADPALAPGRYAVNLSANADWSTDGAWVDARHSFRRWGNADRPWQEERGLKLSADGYPLSDAGILSFLGGYPDGTYRLSFLGKATLSVGGMGRLEGPIVVRDGRSTGRVNVVHSRNELITIRVTAIDPSDPIRDLRLIRPGEPEDSSKVFAGDFLARLRPFSALRLMDWCGVNTSDVKEWGERVLPGSFLMTGSKGVPYEHMIALANESKRDIWINLPDGANDDYARNFAKLLHAKLDPSRRIYLELGNELWNGAFPQFKRMVQAAKNDPSLTRKDDFGRCAEKAAKRLAEVSAIFRSEFGADSKRIIPVLSGQSANPYFAECGLRYLTDHVGEPNTILGAVAIAPYMAIDADRDPPGLTRDELFGAMEDHLEKKLTPWVARHSELARKYGLPMIAYEAGQHLVAWNGNLRKETNMEVKRAAQDDPRMGELYRKLDRMWRGNGGGLLTYFTLASKYGKSGYWGLLSETSNRGSVKWDAVMAIILPPGDVNGDGLVDPADHAIIAKNQGKTKAFRSDGDLDGDGLVDARDLAAFRKAAPGVKIADQTDAK